jgi:hypothetical protein
MRLPVVPAGPWSTAVQPSYQVLPMEDTRQVLGALSRPAVSVVQLRRGGARGRQLWPQGSEPAPARADTRLSLSAGAAAASEASDDAELVALLDASFAQAPPSVRATCPSPSPSPSPGPRPGPSPSPSPSPSPGPSPSPSPSPSPRP